MKNIILSVAAVIVLVLVFYISKDYKSNGIALDSKQESGKEIILKFDQNTNEVKAVDKSTNIETPILLLKKGVVLGNQQSKSPNGDEIFFTTVLGLPFQDPNNPDLMVAYVYKTGEQPRVLFSSKDTGERGP